MSQIHVSFDTDLLQLDRIYDFLSNSYWSPNLQREVFDRGIENSLCIGAYDRETGAQVGFAKVVTDNGRFAYLCDVFVFEEYRGQGIGQAMCAALIDHESLRTVGHWVLATKDAHGVYSKLGFVQADKRYMMLKRSSDRWQQPDPNAS